MDDKVVAISPEDELKCVLTVVQLVGNVVDTTLDTVTVLELPMSVVVSVPDVIDTVLFVSGGEEVIYVVLLSPDKAIVVSDGAAVKADIILSGPLETEQRTSDKLGISVADAPVVVKLSEADIAEAVSDAVGMQTRSKPSTPTQDVVGETGSDAPVIEMSEFGFVMVAEPDELPTSLVVETVQRS